MEKLWVPGGGGRVLSWGEGKAAGGRDLLIQSHQSFMEHWVLGATAAVLLPVVTAPTNFSGTVDTLYKVLLFQTLCGIICFNNLSTGKTQHGDLLWQLYK